MPWGKHKTFTGDALEVLRGLPRKTYQCCVTSPPYWGLRDYGIAGQLGLEATPEEYIAKLVRIFRKVRRVLRDDGTLWLNLGDSYASDTKGSGGPSIKQTRNAGSRYASMRLEHGLKPKDLCGIPWRVALALRADGWYLRADIIWHKPNPMPESVTDRPTKAHEYIFLLTKREKYYYDAEAIKERAVSVGGGASFGKQLQDATGTKAQSRVYERPVYQTRNRQSVWRVTTKAYRGAHFATFPPKLIEPCIKAGTSEKGCCVRCGAPYERVIEHKTSTSRVNPGYNIGAGRNDGGKTRHGSFDDAVFRTTGWRAGCECGADKTPCLVLDPFGGAGTTAVVACGMGRRCHLIELNPDYAFQAERRIRKHADSYMEPLCGLY